ncbi:MAG: heparinase II/III-family protein [Tannerellaceae bacterium]|nr:heparinase II/III-family protein [Tannerellaceae bacterium]
MKKIILLLIINICYPVFGQEIPLPTNLPESYPRLLTTQEYKPELQKQINNEPWAKEVLAGILSRIDPYVDKTLTEPDWVYSRLMMYWKTKATQVYINGGVYSHADGEAPVPTVRFGSTRGVSSSFVRPALEDIIPYMDDTKGVYFRNNSKEGNPLEWVDQSNVSGGSIESINTEIMRLAKDASFIYWLTGDGKYGRFAFDIFDTYLMGMYYRTEPIDIGNSHAQTLSGLSTFEVIQERILDELAYTYDFLHGYIQTYQPANADKYIETLKKWIDITLKNGVPHNNWNLHGGKFILKVAMILENNDQYADGKGREYYIDYILNRNSARQWSLTKFMDYGYDQETGIWNECPGYAQGVTKDLMNFIRDYDNTFNQNILPYTPVMEKAIAVLPQYLFPNNYITAFGDTYYGYIQTEAMSDRIRMAQKYGEREKEVEFTKMYTLFDPNTSLQTASNRSLPPQITSFFTAKPLELDNSISKGKLTDYITPTFYAPNVSWFVQRNKYDDPHNGLMISQYASYGNHAHANGIAIELYGKGYILGAESGIGSSYFEKPYLEYYSQFPAHNTVMVDGISKYPEMLSNHPFDLLNCYPEPAQKEGYYPGITYSEVYFLEPESRSDQNRLLSIVRTGSTTGYYIDIFRSKKQRGGDKFHDYFYHNLGQELVLQHTNGNTLDLKPSDEMAFAGGHLFALDYMWDKQSARTDSDYQALWKMSKPDNNPIYMKLWMKGYPGRELFSIKAPPCKAFRSNNDFPYEVNTSPYLTLAARQHGEAWKHPFVSVFEPYTGQEGSSIESIQSFEVQNASPDFVGLIVKSKQGRTDQIFSSVQEETIQYAGITVTATYAIVAEEKGNYTLFLGNGTLLQAKGCTIQAESPTNVILEYKDGAWYLASEKPVTIRLPGKKKTGYKALKYQKL